MIRKRIIRGISQSSRQNLNQLPHNRMKVLSRQMYRLRHRLPNEDNRKKVIWIVVLLLCSIEIPEIPTYVSYLCPGILRHERDWFWQPSYHLKMVEYYYLKFSCDRVAWIFRMIAFTKTAVQYSTVVFLASLLILAHMFFDLLMLWVNYNTWPLVYEFEIIFLYITIRGLVSPYRQDSFGRIKSIF